MSGQGYERPGIAGSGAIACGLAVSASAAGEVVVLARSPESAERARERVASGASRADGCEGERIEVTVDPAALARCDLVVEAIAERMEAKVALVGEIGAAAPNADLATTTSSLGVADLGRLSGHPERLFGLHPFNPVDRMDLVEVCVPEAVRDGVMERARGWCRSIGKTAIEVPDQPGFVVNRLLFPYLFDAVRLKERTGMSAEDVDACMKLGAGHPMGPLALLDFVGLDVAKAIGESLHADTGDAAHEVPGMIVELVGDGRLGRKSGGGFYEY